MTNVMLVKIEGGVVVDRIVAAVPPEPEEGYPAPPTLAEAWPDYVEAGPEVQIGWTHDGTTFAAPAPEAPPAPTEADVRALAARKLEAIGAPYSPAERETWGPQVAEAERYLAADPGLGANTPILTALAAARGLSLLEMATLVIDKRNTYAAASGAILAAQAQILAMDPIPADFADPARWP